MKGFITAALVLSMVAGLLLPAHAATDPVAQEMSLMTLREKILQMMMVDFRYWDEDPSDGVEQQNFTVMNDQVRQILTDYHFGGVIYFAQNLVGTEQSFRLTQEIQSAAVDSGGIPMLICADQEGGSVYRLATGTALPGNMALSAAGNLGYAELSGRILGSELSALGINTNLAPVVDVNSNPGNPVIGLRSFGDDGAVVGQMASALIEGMSQFAVIGCAKHFPGHGDTAVDSHYGLPVVEKSLEQLRSCELLPYEILIDQGIDMIMTAHILYPQLEQERILSEKTGSLEALPATMSHTIVTELLKQDMGFGGIVVTDAMNMAGVAAAWDPVQATVQAIRAGVDMVCMPCELTSVEDLKTMDAIVDGVAAAVAQGDIPMTRIDDAVLRILRVKEKRGILNWSAENQSLEKALAVVGCDANREAERHIAAAAVTVVENKNQTLPLRLTSSSRVLMLVPYRNEEAQTLLGWNRAAEAGLIPEGAQVKTVCFDGSSTLETFRRELDWADILIIHSEVNRVDRLDGGHWLSAYPLQVISYAKTQGKTVIVQSVDKPYDVQSYEEADAVIAVYGCKGSSLDPTEVLTGGLTGSEMAFGPNIVAGIEVIFGVFGAQGKLPVAVPKYENGAFTQEIRYERGWGLTYESLLPEAEIPEAPETTFPQSTPTTQPSPEEPVSQPIPWAWLVALMGSFLLLGIVLPKGRKNSGHE